MPAAGGDNWVFPGTDQGGVDIMGGVNVADLLGMGDSAALGGAFAQPAGGVTASGDLSTYSGVKGSLTVGVTGMPADTYAKNAGGGYPQTISSILDQAQNTVGKRVSARAIRQAAKQYGVYGAASIFGLGPEDIGFLFAGGTSSRRGRGVSARQLRNVGRVLRVFGGMRKQLDKYVHRSHAVTPTHHQFAHHKGKK